MTVSRVLNDSGAVSAETRARVLHWVQVLGFRKDRFASINARRRGGRLAPPLVVIDAYHEPQAALESFDFYSRVLLAAVRRLSAAGCETIISDLTRHPDHHRERLAEADAVVCCSPLPEAAHDLITGLNPRLAMVTVCHHRAGASAVMPDDRAGGILAAEQALAAGCRRAAILSAPGMESFDRRSQAFAERFRAGDPAAEVEQISYAMPAGGGVGVAPAVIEAAIAAWWERSSRRPDVCFATGGYAALQLYRWLRGRGLSIPADIGLIGYDALPFYDHLDTPLSRIVFPVEELGRLAAEEVLRRLDPAADGPGADRLVPCSFIDRASLAPACAGTAHVR